MGAMLATALLLWGYLLPVHIVVIDGTDPSFHGYATTDRWSDPSVCTVRIYPRFDELTAIQQQGVVTHEVGHCLGMDDVGYPSIMSAPTYWTDIQPADLTVFHQLHPGSARAIVVGAVAADGHPGQ